MRIVVVGGEGLPRQAALALLQSGEDVTFVERDEGRATGVEEPATISGDPAVPATLERAGARSAEVLAALTRSDADNLVVSYLAKHRFGVPCVVARVNDPDNAWMFDESWGVDVAICPSDLMAAAIRAQRGAKPDGADRGADHSAPPGRSALPARG